MDQQELLRRILQLEARLANLVLPEVGQPLYRVYKVLAKAAIADNVATPIFTITTTNEAGNNDGGGYSCHMVAFVGHAAGATTANSSVRYWAGHFNRAMMNTGAGSNSAVIEEYDDAEAATAVIQRGIVSTTVTVAETSEYVQTVSFQIDLSGASVDTAEVVVEVEVLYYGFLTAPAIAVV